MFSIPFLTTKHVILGQQPENLIFFLSLFDAALFLLVAPYICVYADTAIAINLLVKLC